MVNELEASGQQAKLVLLHCHIGSQIADIQVLKQATKEVTQIYAELVKRGVRPASTSTSAAASA